MNTRLKKEQGPLSQNRYMSSVEFAELRGISGVAVSTRAAILIHEPKRELIWFFQALSLNEGGIRRVAKELVEMFPERLGTEKMHKSGVKPEKICPGEIVCGVELDLNRRHEILSSESTAPQKGKELLAWCREAALSHWEEKGQYCQSDPFSIEAAS